ncbi:MAG: TonB family protein [Pseudomonadota bacterium]
MIAKHWGDRTPRSLIASAFLICAPLAAANQPGWQRLDNAKEQFDEQFQEGDFETCINTAKWMLNELADIPDATPADRGLILARLAEAQQRAGRLEPATQNYAAALELVESGTSILDDQLEAPTWQYARLLDTVGKIDEAAAQYERALHLHTVNHGLQDPDLADYLLEVSDFYYRQGDAKQARALNAYRVDLLRRHYGIDSLEILPALYDYAETLEKTGDLLGAQAEYRDIMRRIKNTEGRRSPLMIPVVGKLANLFLYNEMYDGYDGVKQARRYYQVMMDLTERNPGAATTEQKVAAYSGMGDYYTLKTNNAEKAAIFYRQAWEHMASDPETEATNVEQHFSEPVVLNDVPTVHGTGFKYWRDRAQRRGMKRGVVVLRYDVGPDGRMTNVRIAESSPERFKDFMVLKQLRRFVYRPALRNGDPIVAKDIEYRFEYAYWEQEYLDFLERGISNIRVARSVTSTDQR